MSGRGKCNLRNVIIFLQQKNFSAAEAKSLGVALKVPIFRIDAAIANNGVNGSYDLALIDIIQNWIYDDSQASWDTLADALSLVAKTIASEIRQCKDQEFTLPNILKALKSNGFSSTMARSLGQMLGLPEPRLKSIMANRGVTSNVAMALADIIQAWFENEKASWSKLDQALENIKTKETPTKDDDQKSENASKAGAKAKFEASTDVGAVGNDPNVQADSGSEENTCRNTGFSLKDTTSVVYSGKKDSLYWDKYGIALLFEDRKVPYEEDSGCPIKVSVVESNEFIYPETFKEAISTIYHIDCPKPLYATVTIRINHTVAEEDRKNLHLLCSDDKQPPYHFSILNDAQFTSAYGEIKVNKFSFFLLAKLKQLFGYCNDVFEASLYYKDNSICQNRGQHKLFFIYITIVKSTSVLKDSMKEYISRQYGDLIKHGDTEVLYYNDINGDINVSTEIWKSNPHHEVTLEPSQSFSLNQSIITDYESGCPPHRRYTIKANIERGWKVNVNLRCTTNRQCTLSFDPDIVMDDAEVSRIHQEDSRNRVHEIYIKDGEVGHSYSSIFQRCLDDNVYWVELQDPYFRNDNQINNLVRFCEVMVNGCVKLKELKIITSPDNKKYKNYEENMSKLTESLERHKVTMSTKYSSTLHDREVRFNTGWIVNLGRGLDYFRSPDGPFSIGFHNYDLRPCRENKITIYWKESGTSDSPTQ